MTDTRVDRMVVYALIESERKSAYLKGVAHATLAVYTLLLIKVYVI